MLATEFGSTNVGLDFRTIILFCFWLFPKKTIVFRIYSKKKTCSNFTVDYCTFRVQSVYVVNLSRHGTTKTPKTLCARELHGITTYQTQRLNLHRRVWSSSRNWIFFPERGRRKSPGLWWQIIVYCVDNKDNCRFGLLFVNGSAEHTREHMEFRWKRAADQWRSFHRVRLDDKRRDTIRA